MVEKTITKCQKMSERKNKKLGYKQRRKKVTKLYYRKGLTQEEVAKKIGVSERTVIRDLNSIRDQLAEKFNEDNINSLISELLEEEREDIREITRQYEDLEGKDKIVAMSEKRRLRKELVDKLISLGLVDHAPQKVELNYVDRIVDKVFGDV